jgi:hypothetical protein
MEMPKHLPFSGCQFEPGQNMKYRSAFDVQTLIGSARDELAIVDPEAFKVFLLGTMVGLRRREIDLLEWSSFRWDEGAIRIEATQHFSAKSEDSYADVAIDAQLVQLFRGYHARATGPFVIESNGDLRPGCTYVHYRCNEIFNRLISWLRARGVKALKPLHTLRKEFGSVLCANYGIHAASRGFATLRGCDHGPILFRQPSTRDRGYGSPTRAAERRCFPKGSLRDLSRGATVEFDRAKAVRCPTAPEESELSVGNFRIFYRITVGNGPGFGVFRRGWLDLQFNSFTPFVVPPPNGSSSRR